MSAATERPTYPVRFDDTETGRATLWVRGFVCPPQQAPIDFHDALESLGCRKAAQMMREEATA